MKLLKGLFEVVSKLSKGLLKVVGKLFSVRTMIIVGLIVLICVGIGLGLGLGKGDGEGDGNSKVETNQENTATVENDVIENTTEEVTEENSNDVYEGAVLNINVVGNEYFYENERIDVDSFISKTTSIEGEVVVYVKDDNASLKAYNGLIDRLEEEKIDYVEK